eukprot:COSAG06_NODE_4948_length_3839_cov_3.741979_3_plen_59_part_00
MVSSHSNQKEEEDSVSLTCVRLQIAPGGQKALPGGPFGSSAGVVSSSIDSSQIHIGSH